MNAFESHVGLGRMGDLELAEVRKNYRPRLIADAPFDQDLRHRLADDTKKRLFEQPSVFVVIVYAEVYPIGPCVIELDAGKLNVAQLRARKITAAQDRSRKIRATQIGARHSAGRKVGACQIGTLQTTAVEPDD